MLLFLLPILQACAAGVTIWGFINAPAVSDTVVTYGMSADGSPDMADWVNSFGSIALGIGGMVATWIAQHKSGARSELYLATNALVSHPTDTVALIRLQLAALSCCRSKWASDTSKQPVDPEDVKAIEYMEHWIKDKYLQEPTPVALNNIK